MDPNIIISEGTNAFPTKAIAKYSVYALLCCFKESFIFSWWSIVDVTELSYQNEAS